MNINVIASHKVQEARMAACKACKFYKHNTRSCGTLIKGDTINYRKNKIKLCGCIMDAKTRIAWATCPAGKWPDNKWSYDERKAALEFFDKCVEEGKIKDPKKFWELLEKASGRKVEPTQCTPCLNDMINVARRELKDYFRAVDRQLVENE